ncbi:inorganic phosphate transporter, partial [Acinetobacter baumannii]
FAHGSNDGQKGMGLIMLILIGTVPTAYALNRAVDPTQIAGFSQVSQQMVGVLDRIDPAAAPVADTRAVIPDYLKTRTATPVVYPALS